MVSPMALTCNHYAARCTKIGTEILRQKNSEKEENAPDSARKRRNRMRSGCWREVQRVRTDGKTGIDRHRTCLGCRLGRAWTQPTGLQAPTTRTAGEPAGAPRCQILPHTNEKSQVPYKRYLTFLAGAEGLEPSARGFGVDVETAHKERGRGSIARFLP